MRVYVILLLLIQLALTPYGSNVAGPARAGTNLSLPSSIIAPTELPPMTIPPAQGQPSTHETAPGSGVWRTFTNSNCLSNLIVAGDYVWGATCAGLMRWNRADGHYVRYTTADGLAGNRITAMASDGEGRVWVGAAGKVSVFEGQRWATYPVNDDRSGGDIRVMAAGPAGQLWVGTSNGVRMFDGQRWHTYTVDDGLGDIEVRAIAVDGAGQPWVAVGHTYPTGGWSGSGLSMFDGQRWHNYTAAEGLAGNWVTTIVIDGTGRPWVGSRYGGVSVFDDQTWRTYTIADGLASNIVDALAIDPDGQPWVASRYEGLSQFDGQGWTTYPLPEALANDPVQAMAIDPTAQVWLSTRSRVSGFAGERWTTYTVANDLPDNLIQTIVTDETGQLWVGAAGGVNTFDGQTWTAYAAAVDLASPDVTAIAVKGSEQVWVGTLHSGLSLLDSGQWTTYTTTHRLVSNDITTIALDAAGQPWVGTMDGLSAFDGQRWTTYTVADGLTDDLVKAIAIDPTGRVWVGTTDGLNSFEGQTWIAQTDGWFSGIVLDPQGRVWVSTADGVSMLGGQNRIDYTVADGLLDNFVTALAIDTAGRIWAGHKAGLSMFDGQRWTTYTAADGLAGEEVSAITADPVGNIWVGFDDYLARGVSVFDGQHWLTYTGADGLVDQRVRDITVDTAGRLWFATAGGVSLFDPHSQRDSLTPVPSKPATPLGLSQPAAPTVQPSSEPGQEITPLPPPTHLAPTAPPVQPLRAWTVAADGAVFVLDGTNSLYQLDPADLTPLAQSAPLFQAQPEDRVHLLADQTYLFAGNEAITQTLSLKRADFSEVTRLDQVGPMALEPGKYLFLGSQDLFHLPPYTGEFLIYDLADLSQPPQAIQTQCLPNPLLAEPVSRRLYVQTRGCLSSPPHQGDIYHLYALDTLEEIGIFQPDPYRGYLARPAMAERAGFGVTVNYGLSSVNDLYFFDPQGRTLHTEKYTKYAGTPAIDAGGAWLYLRLGRGLMARRSGDLSVQSFLPFTQTVPADLALSPDDKTLYLFGNGWLTALPTTELQGLGIVPLSPFPTAWTQEERQHTYLYRSPDIEKDGTAFIQLTPSQLPSNASSEIYRTSDGGRSWHSLPVLEDYISVLSLSPDFATDRTLVTGYQRSTDAGETWEGWEPRIAFTSDREGNREIYTMDGKSYTADAYDDDLQRLTDNPAADENPAWSPAWTRLAFQSQRSGNWDIFSLRAECDPPQAECDLRRLTISPADDLLPAWSPDGRTIAFVSQRDGNPEIYLMDKDGRNQRRLTFHPGGDWRPAWLPDSQHLVFTSDREGTNDIYLVAVPPDAAPLTSEPALTPVITGPADDRDPAVSKAGILAFLSDRDGFKRAYTLNLRDPNDQVEAHEETDQAEAHPSWFDQNTLLLTVERGGDENIYGVLYEYSPLTTASGFDGQPAGEPAWWEPDETASLEWLYSRK